MNPLDLIRRLHQHRAWVTRQLMDVAEQLSEGQLRKTFPIGQGSIWQSLLHLYGGEYVWLESLEGNDRPLVPGDIPEKLPGNQLGQNPITTLPELRARWKSLDDRWAAYLAELRPEALDDIVHKVSSGPGKRHGTHRHDVLLHVCTHAHYTTAQVMNMMRHVGVERLPDPMLITLARQECEGGKV